MSCTTFLFRTHKRTTRHCRSLRKPDAMQLTITMEDDRIVTLDVGDVGVTVENLKAILEVSHLEASPTPLRCPLARTAPPPCVRSHRLHREPCRRRGRGAAGSGAAGMV